MKQEKEELVYLNWLVYWAEGASLCIHSTTASMAVVTNTTRRGDGCGRASAMVTALAPNWRVMARENGGVKRCKHSVGRKFQPHIATATTIGTLWGLCCATRVELCHEGWVVPRGLCCATRAVLCHEGCVVPRGLCCATRAVLCREGCVSNLNNEGINT